MRISTANYGLCLFNKDNLSNFIARNGNSRKKILAQLIDDHELYLKSLKEGVFIPIPEIDSIDYLITFNAKPDNNIVKFKCGNFNLCVINNEFWISDIGLLNKPNLKAFEENNKIKNQLLSGDIECIAEKHFIENGKYEVNIIGSVDTNNDPCFSFIFSKCDEFVSMNDPREDEYIFEFD